MPPYIYGTTPEEEGAPRETPSTTTPAQPVTPQSTVVPFNANISARSQTGRPQNSSTPGMPKPPMQPVMPSPTMPQRGTTQPVVPQPGITQPGMTQPGTTRPAAPQQAMPRTSMPQPAMPQPGMTQPMPQSGTAGPGMTQPMMPGSGMTQPGMTQPMMPGPGMTQPGMTQPMMPGSGTTQPGMTQPMMPGSGMTGPGMTQPMMPGLTPQTQYPPYQGIPNMYLPEGYSVPMGVPMYPLYGYDNSADLDRDIQYMRQLYPKTAKRIQKEIDNECDKLEYDGSMMFDEYPDKEQLDRIIDRIYERIKNMDEEPQLEANSLYLYPPRRSTNYLRDIVSLLLLSEIFNRRRRYRSRRRWF